MTDAAEEERRERLRRERVRRREFRRMLDESSIGVRAWIDCPTHGRTARDPFTDVCVECPGIERGGR